jgi:predicted lipoprotein with Yx(FWY)xxD motif
MTTSGKVACAVIALTGLAGITAGTQHYLLAAPETPAPAVVAVAQTSPPRAAPEKPRAVPKKPTVAKVQKWVKIYSGPSATDLKPPKSTKGSRVVELNVTPNDQIGDYVSDGAGRTLYRFDDDSATPPRSVCNGDCAETWPPLLIKSPGKIYPNGINPKILGYVERADGHCQVTIDGHPVYYFSGDTKAGDYRGQGLANKWFAVTATGGRTHFLFDNPPSTKD